MEVVEDPGVEGLEVALQEGLGEVLQDGVGVQRHELVPARRVHYRHVAGVGPVAVVY